MSFQLAGLRAGMITQVALVRPLTGVTAPMYYQIALKLEGLSTELAGLHFACLAQGWWRPGLGSSRKWLCWRSQKCRWLGTRLKERGAEKPVHRGHTIRWERRCGPTIIVVAGQLTEASGEIHGWWFHGHWGQAHHPLKGTGMLGESAHLLWAQTLKGMTGWWRWTYKWWCRWQTGLQVSSRLRFSQKGCCHAEQVEWVAVVSQKTSKRRARQGICTQRVGQCHTGCKGTAGRVVVQVDTDAMCVLSMLQQEPGAGKGLLACGADVAGGLIFPWKTQRVQSVNECINISA